MRVAVVAELGKVGCIGVVAGCGRCWCVGFRVDGLVALV